MGDGGCCFLDLELALELGVYMPVRVNKKNKKGVMISVDPRSVEPKKIVTCIP